MASKKLRGKAKEGNRKRRDAVGGARKPGVPTRYPTKRAEITPGANFTLKKVFAEQIKLGKKTREARPKKGRLADISCGDWIIFRYGGRFSAFPRLFVVVTSTASYANLGQMLEVEWQKLIPSAASMEEARSAYLEIYGQDAAAQQWVSVGLGRCITQDKCAEKAHPFDLCISESFFVFLKPWEHRPTQNHTQTLRDQPIPTQNHTQAYHHSETTRDQPKTMNSNTTAARPTETSPKRGETNGGRHTKHNYATAARPLLAWALGGRCISQAPQALATTVTCAEQAAPPEVCSICAEAGNVWFGKACCGVPICAACADQHARTRSMSGAIEVTCPGNCGCMLTQAEVGKVVGASTVKSLHQNSINRATAAAPEFYPCPTPDCRMVFAIGDACEAKLTCPLCKKHSCWRCGAQPPHEGKSCPPKRDADLEPWIAETGSRRCPQCNVPVSKGTLDTQQTQENECHLMQCRVCGCKFCFQCLATITDTHRCSCTPLAHVFVDPLVGCGQTCCGQAESKAQAPPSTPAAKGKPKVRAGASVKELSEDAAGKSI